MRIFKNRWFVRFARKERISDNDLRDAILRAMRGSIDADLGGGLIKQRLARRGQGRSGGYRTIIVYRSEDRAIFLFGFSKSNLDNLEPDELSAFKEVARELLNLGDDALAQLIEAGRFTEIDYDA